MIITSTELINLIKFSIYVDGQDVKISINDLMNLDHRITPDVLADTLMELKEVKMSDEGFIIPNIYFK